MITNYQNADMLDIIFENRNQSYGAYALRRSYNKSLQQAILITLSSIFLLCFGNFLREKLSKSISKQSGPSVILDVQNVGPIVIPKKEDQQVKPPKPLIQPPTHAAAIATAHNTELKVVKSNLPVQDTIIPTKDLANLNSGLTTNTNAPVKGIGVSDGTGTDATFNVQRNDGPSPIVIAPDKMPEFPGGEEALLRFLSNNTTYPNAEREIGTQGKAFIQFVVNEDGSISNTTVVKSASSGFSREALRVVSMLPKFKPGLQQGHPVRVQYVLPFTFRIKD